MTEVIRLQKDTEDSSIRSIFKNLNNKGILNVSDSSKSLKGTNLITACPRTNLKIQGHRDDNRDHEGKHGAIISSLDKVLPVEKQIYEQTNFSNQFVNKLSSTVVNKQSSTGSFPFAPILNLPDNNTLRAGKSNQALDRDIRPPNTDFMLKSYSCNSHDDSNLNTSCPRNLASSQANREKYHEHKRKQRATKPSPCYILHKETQEEEQSKTRQQFEYDQISKGSFCHPFIFDIPANTVNLAGVDDHVTAEHRMRKDSANINDTELCTPDPRDTEHNTTGSCNHFQNQQDLVGKFQCEVDCDKAMDLRQWDIPSSCRDEHSKKCNHKDELPEGTTGSPMVESSNTTDLIHNKELEHNKIGRRKLFDPG